MRKVQGFPGVYTWTKMYRSPYCARVRRNDRWIFSKSFRTPEDAAAAYDEIVARVPPGKPGRKLANSSGDRNSKM